MFKFSKMTMAWGTALLAGIAMPAMAYAAELSVVSGSTGRSVEFLRTQLDRFEADTGHTVTIVPMPSSTTDQFGQYRLWLAAGNTDIDLYTTDVIWAPQLADQFLDLTEAAKGVVSDFFPSIIESQTVDGKLVALPSYTGAPALYYRKDLLEKYGRPVPETWADLTETARTIMKGEREAGRGNMWGFVWQGRAYEGLTVNALEWVVSFNGGTIVDLDGKITINNPRAVEAIDTAASWVNDITPQGVLNYSEEEARGVFQSGNAVFMRNWPYAWQLVNAPDSAIKDQVAVAVLPKGGADGKHTGGLGGWQLAVSKYSAHANEAIDLVRYLTGREEQKRRAIAGGFKPTIPALYDDPEVLAASPFMKELYQTFLDAAARPSGVTGVRYNQVSAEFWNSVHSVLSGQDEAKTAMAQLERTLDRVSRGGRW